MRAISYVQLFGTVPSLRHVKSRPCCGFTLESIHCLSARPVFAAMEISATSWQSRAT